MQQHDNIDPENLRREILEELPNAEEWLASPNMRLRGQTPDQAIAAGELATVRNLVYSILFVGVF